MRRTTMLCVTFGLLAAAVGATSASARPVPGHRCSTPSNFGNDATPAVAPASRGVLYSRHSWSRDGGRSWAQSPLCGGSVYGFSRAETTLTVDQQDPRTICAQSSDRATGGGPLLSVDGGRHWKPSFDCTTIARLGRGGPLVSPVPGEAAIDVSTDGGTSWTPTPADVAPVGSMSIASDPTRPRGLYGRGEADPTWTYHSVDGGAHWTPVSVPVEIDSQVGELWLGRTTGATWKRSTAHLATAPTGFDAAGVLYQVVGAHPRVSRDDGLSWTRR